MEHRNRAVGWKYAKLSGHRNEDLVKDALDKNEEFGYSFLKRVNRSEKTIVTTSVGGLHEMHVQSINGGKTTSKTDLKVYLSSDEVINVSIKKSLEGQVYFVGADIFINTFERQFNKEIPLLVQRAIRLFWRAADDAVDIIQEFADRSDIRKYNMQIRHKSLNATTLKNYDEELYYGMLEWFCDNSYELALLSFSRGAAADRSEWSDFVWYINLLGEHDIDDIILIDDICTASRKVARDETYCGSKNGGTTIQLPFGFVQWHQGKLQFHHTYDKVSQLVSY